MSIHLKFSALTLRSFCLPIALFLFSSLLRLSVASSNSSSCSLKCTRMQTILTRRWVGIYVAVECATCALAHTLHKEYIHDKYLSFVVVILNCAENWVLIEIETRCWCVCVFSASIFIFWGHLVWRIIASSLLAFDLNTWHWCMDA